jgi:hypothetical protein
MGEQSVIFRDNQELQANDLNNMQGWIGQSLDHVVLDTIEPSMSYSGFTISKVAPTQINVAPGRLYSAGQVYARNEVVTLDFYNALPVTQKKQIAVVCWGSSITQDIQPRDFIIDADTGQSQPQSVAMTNTRYCNVDFVPGVEGPSPQFPTIDATDLLIGYVLCDPTGVVSFQQSTDNIVDNIRDLAQRMLAVETFEATVAGQVAILTTALAALANQLKNYVLLTDYQKLVTLVNQIWDLIHQPSAYIWYGTDNFLDASLSLTSGNVDGAYNAVVDEGLRFPGSNSDATVTSTLQLLNPTDPSAQVAADGFTLPTPSGSRVRLDCTFPSFPWIEERILQYIFHTFTLRHLRPARIRHRCGIPWLPCPMSQVWWYQAQLDPTYRILSFLTETWEVVQWADIAQHPEGSIDWPQHNFERWKYFWRDRVTIPYWAKVFDNFDHSGNHICQTFLNAQDGWLSSVTVYMLNQLAQPMDLLISGVQSDGTPDHLQQTIRRISLDGPGVQACFDAPIQVGDIEQVVSIPRPGILGVLGFRTIQRVSIPVYVYPLRITFPPVFLAAGERYGLHYLTTADHRFCISDQWDLFAVHQGHYWTSITGGLLQMWASTTNPKSLRFKLHYCTWGQWQGNNSGVGGSVRAEIQLQSLQLAGGISGIDVLADAIEPAATDLSYQIQVNGAWQKFDYDPNTPDLSTNPALLPFKIVFTGTTDLMPGVSLTQSQVQVHGVRSNSFHHISKAIILGSSATHVKVTAKLLSFVSAHHTCVCSIHFSTTHATADVVADVTLDDGTLERTWTFNQSISSGGSGFYVEMDGTSDGVGDRFIVAQEIRYAAP